MRWVFVGIVALNLLYFGWRMASDAELSGPELARAEDVARKFPSSLVLLHERSPAETAAVGSRAPAPTANILPALAGCPAVGPFGEDKKDAERVARALGSAGVGGAVRQVELRAAAVFRVYIPALESREAALRKLRELHAKGIDSFVVVEGSDANAISLGSFTSRDSALGMQAQLRASGYRVEIREQVKNVRQAWVVLAEPQAQGFHEFIPPDLQAGVRPARLPCAGSR